MNTRPAQGTISRAMRIRQYLETPGGFLIGLAACAVLVGAILILQKPTTLKARIISLKAPDVRGLAPKDREDLLLRYEVELARLQEQAEDRTTAQNAQNRDRHQATVAGVISVFIGGLTIGGAIWNQARQANNATLLKAAELIVGAEGFSDTERRSEIVRSLFHEEIDGTRVNNFLDWLKERPYHADRRGLVNHLIGAHSIEEERRIVNLWLKAFPGDDRDPLVKGIAKHVGIADDKNRQPKKA